MLLRWSNGDIVYKRTDKMIVVDHISPIIMMERLECAGYSHMFAVLSVTHQINMTDKAGAVKLGQALGLLQ